VSTQGWDEREPDPEWANVLRWRYRAARHAGLTHVEATLFAESDGNTAQLRGLKEHGATPEQIRRICL
jgi:hypothetical protein